MCNWHSVELLPPAAALLRLGCTRPSTSQRRRLQQLPTPRHRERRHTTPRGCHEQDHLVCAGSRPGRLQRTRQLVGVVQRTVEVVVVTQVAIDGEARTLQRVAGGTDTRHDTRVASESVSDE
jgi:hypothetical protein